MGAGTSSGKSGQTSGANAGGATASYMSQIQKLDSMTALNNLVERAANDEGLTSQEYQRIYDAAIKRVQRIG